MITTRQVRAARSLLGWTRQELADKAVVSLNAVARLEAGQVDSRMSTFAAVQKALEQGGVVFLSTDHDLGEGVRFRNPDL